jgi:hypothetical protein
VVCGIGINIGIADEVCSLFVQVKDRIEKIFGAADRAPATAAKIRA